MYSPLRSSLHHKLGIFIVLLDKELLAQRLQGLEQEAENKKRSQDDRTRQLKGLEVRVLRGWPAAARVLAQV